MGGLTKYNLGTGEGTICSSDGQVRPADSTIPAPLWSHSRRVSGSTSPISSVSQLDLGASTPYCNLEKILFSQPELWKKILKKASKYLRLQGTIKEAGVLDVFPCD
jgi:hypothetical protein